MSVPFFDLSVLPDPIHVLLLTAITSAQTLCSHLTETEHSYVPCQEGRFAR